MGRLINTSEVHPHPLQVSSQAKVPGSTGAQTTREGLAPASFANHIAWNLVAGFSFAHTHTRTYCHIAYGSCLKEHGSGFLAKAMTQHAE